MCTPKRQNTHTHTQAKLLSTVVDHKKRSENCRRKLQLYVPLESVVV